MLLSKNECQNPRFTPGSLLSLAPSIVSSVVSHKTLHEYPRQQFAYLIDRMLGDAREDMALISLGIKAIEFGGLCRALNYAE
jgi:hypothetical protein